MIATAIRSRGTLASLNPASITERGIPYTTHVASASVSTVPPRALIQAAPSRPSAPIPVITTPSVRAPNTLAAETNSTSTDGRWGVSRGSRLRSART